MLFRSQIWATPPIGGDWVNDQSYVPYQADLNAVLCTSDGQAFQPSSSNGAIANVRYVFSRGDAIQQVGGTQNPRRGVFEFNRCARLADITDGTSNTAAISERAVYTGAPNKVKGGYCMNVSGLDSSPIIAMAFEGPDGTFMGCTPTDSHRRVGESWASGYAMCTGFNTVLPPNAPMASSSKGEWSWGVFPPSSYHPGGVIVGRCDGSASFVSETVDTGDLSQPEARISGNPASPYGAWGAFGSMNGGESIPLN